MNVGFAGTSAHRRRGTISVLLSKGFSLSARQTISALGPLGYQLDGCDANSLCLGHFSRPEQLIKQLSLAGAHRHQ